MIDKVLQPVAPARGRAGVSSPAPALLREAARGRRRWRGPRSAHPLRAHPRPTARAASSAPARSASCPIQARVPRRRLLRLAAARRPVRQAARRHPEPRGPGAHARQGDRRTSADVRRLRHRLDQARTGRPHRPHQVRRDGDHPAPHQRPRQLVAAAESPSEESILELLESRGVAWTDLDGWHRLDEHEEALGAPRVARASRSCRATRWSTSRAASERARAGGR